MLNGPAGLVFPSPDIPQALCGRRGFVQCGIRETQAGDAEPQSSTAVGAATRYDYQYCSANSDRAFTLPVEHVY